MLDPLADETNLTDLLAEERLQLLAAVWHEAVALVETVGTRVVCCDPEVGLVLATGCIKELLTDAPLMLHAALLLTLWVLLSGVYGAVIPLVLVCLMYIGFSASGSLLAGQAVAQLLHVEDWVGIVLFELT